MVLSHCNIVITLGLSLTKKERYFKSKMPMYNNIGI